MNTSTEPSTPTTGQNEPDPHEVKLDFYGSTTVGDTNRARDLLLQYSELVRFPGALNIPENSLGVVELLTQMRIVVDWKLENEKPMPPNEA